MLTAQNLHFAYAGGKTLLDGVSFRLDAGERVALVGENGAGKSSLMSLMMGRMPLDDGTLSVPKDRTVGILWQTPELDPDSTVWEVAKSGLAHLIGLIERHTALCANAGADPAALDEIESLTAQIELRGGFSVDHRIAHTLENLGVHRHDQKIAELSGGERRRVDLARILLEDPDVLLLDEPTNHLDRRAVDFLATTLMKRTGALLFVSHDRAFLDRVATRILELDRGEVFDHAPPYAQFIENRLVRVDLEKRTTARKKRILAREVAWLRAGVKARTTKQNARLDRAHALIDEVQHEVTRNKERALDVRKAKEARLAKTILEFQDLSVGRGERVFFEHLDLICVQGERWGIVGPNGAGKTSLLSVLLGTHTPRAGEVVLGKHTKVGYLDQHRDALTEDLTVQEHLCPDGGDTVFVGEERVHVASYLERFLFDPDDRRRQVKTLSGGEQNRLQLAKLFAEGHNCLLLDEPTNDLDVTTLGVLEQTLEEHQGVALIVSHDRTFLDRVCTGILAFEPDETGAAEHKVVPVQGDYTHYLRTRGEGGSQAADNSDKPAKADKSDKAPAPAREKKKTKRSYKEEQEYQSIEGRILEMEARKEEIEAALADGGIFSSDPDQARAMSEELSALGPTIETAYARWQELEEIGG